MQGVSKRASACYFGSRLIRACNRRVMLSLDADHNVNTSAHPPQVPSYMSASDLAMISVGKP